MAQRVLQPIAAGACRRWAAVAAPTSTGAACAKRGLATGARVRPLTIHKYNPTPQWTSFERPTAAPSTDVLRQRRGFRSTALSLDDAADEGGGGGAKRAPAVKGVSTGEPASNPKIEELFQEIVWLDMVEVHLLAELINEKMGVKITDADRKRMAGGGKKKKKKGGAEAEEEVVEKTSFDLRLTGFDAKSKIKVIKEVRAMTSLGLKEAKELVEGAPTFVKKGIKMEEAEELKAKLEAIGAQVEIA